MEMQQAAPQRRRWLGLALTALSAFALPRAAATEAGAGHEWRPWPKGRAVPPLDLPRLEGGRFSLREQRGKVVLLNFWATWCVPCRDEMPSLARLAEAERERGLVLAAVNHREAPGTIRRFLETLAAPLPVLLDESGEAAKSWTPRIFPTTVLIDRRGRPAGMIVGEMDWNSAAARQRVGPLLDSA